MKKLAFYIILLGIIAGCNGNRTSHKYQSKGYFTGKPVIRLDKTDIDFGQISEGEEVMVPFTIKNSGDAPLIIYKVETSCGCTASDYPHEPIRPGQQAEIKLIFNSAGYSGYQIKTAKLYTNSKDSIITLTIHGIVK